MGENLTPIRRVVTGNDELGRSRVIWDGSAPNTHPVSIGAMMGYTDIWVWAETPAPLNGETDDGNLTYAAKGPPNGGHVHVSQARKRPADYDPAKDTTHVPMHEPKMRPGGRIWDRGGNSLCSSAMHKTETVDYAILLDGEWALVLDDVEVPVRRGDVVIQVGAWHQWVHSLEGGLMAFDMIGTRFVDGSAGLVQGDDPVMPVSQKDNSSRVITKGRRIVTVDREIGKGSLVSDGPSPDVRVDPARPGFACARMWVTDGMPAKIAFESLHLPYILEPPRNGTVMNIVTFPPDASWKKKVGAPEVQAFFRSIGSPGASTYSRQAPHPYMQKTRTLDFCFVIDGEIVLVLDTQEVLLHRGDIVVQRATNHAWSNRSDGPAVVAIASHDGAW